MRLSLLPRYTWRWWAKPLACRFGLRTAEGRFVQYAQGIAWSVRFGPIVLTRFAGCTCREA